MLRCWARSPGKERARPLLLLQVHAASLTVGKRDAEFYFYFSPVFITANILFIFLSISENRYLCRAFRKAKGCKVNFWKAEFTCVVLFFCEWPIHIPWKFPFGFPALSFWFVEAACAAYTAINHLWVLDSAIIFSQLSPNSFSHVL